MNLAAKRAKHLAARRKAAAPVKLCDTIAQLGEEGWNDYMNGDGFSAVYIGRELEAYAAGWNAAKASR